MKPRVRVVVASGLLCLGALVAVGLAFDAIMSGEAGRSVGQGAQAVALVAAATGMVFGWWWARLVAMAAATATVQMGAYEMLNRVVGAPAGFMRAPELPEIVATLMALALLVAVSGRAMWNRHERRAPPPLDWTRPRMGVVRAAVITSSATIVAQLTLLAQAAAHEGVHWGSYLPWSGGVAVVAAVAVLALVVGLGLLVLQRPAGLWLAGLASLALAGPFTGHYLVSDLQLSSTITREDLLLFAVLFAPGLLTTWAAVLVGSRAIARRWFATAGAPPAA